MPDTSIPIDSDVRDDLRGLKQGDETYTEVIERLIGRGSGPCDSPICDVETWKDDERPVSAVLGRKSLSFCDAHCLGEYMLVKHPDSMEIAEGTVEKAEE